MNKLTLGQTVYTFHNIGGTIVSRQWRVFGFKPENMIALKSIHGNTVVFKSHLVVKLEDCELYSVEEEVARRNDELLCNVV